MAVFNILWLYLKYQRIIRKKTKERKIQVKLKLIIQGFFKVPTCSLRKNVVIFSNQNKLDVILNKYVVLLVKQDNVGFPDFVWWQPQDAYSSVLGLVPLKLIVVPDQPKPNVAGHNLILLILKDKKKTIKQHQATKG